MNRQAGSSSALLRQLWPRWVSLGESLFPSMTPLLEEELHNFLEVPAVWRRVTSGLDRMAGLAVRDGVCAHVLIHANLADDLEHPALEPAFDRVAEAARVRGLSVTRIVEAHRPYDTRSLRIGVDDAHPNEAGHRLLAQLLHDGLRALPARCLRLRSERAPAAGL
jgi:hypothetical protein